MDWARHQQDWPLAAHSRFVLCKPHRWHVQQMGAGADVVLLHGAGGGTQSWRHLMPLLAPHARVIAVDLPGQGFTKSGAGQRHGLSEMATDIAALATSEGWHPQAIIGHSAGGAIALEIARNMPTPPVVVGINAALSPFKGLAGIAFPMIAKTLSVLPGVAQLFTASTARPGSVTRLIEGTGSTLPPEDLRWYRALISDRTHVDATLSMMAQWDLAPLLSALPEIETEALLIACAQDKAVPPETAARAAERLPHAQTMMLPDLGHLAHEEDAERMAEVILPFLRTSAVIA